MVKQEMRSNEHKSLKFSKKEISLLEEYCNVLGYTMSINDQKKVVKVFYNKTFRYGYLRKEKDGIFYGFFKKNKEGNSFFVGKENILSNLDMFSFFKERINDNWTKESALKENFFRRLMGLENLELVPNG